MDHTARGKGIAKVWEENRTILQGKWVYQRYGNKNGPYCKR